MRKVLTIAGSDCSGGAGIQADLKTISAFGEYGMSVITALTAQNTLGVTGVVDVEPCFVEKQLDAIFCDIYPDSIKIGMVSNKDIIKSIVKKLKEYNAKNIVVDPVMISTSGSKLLNEDAIFELTHSLFPLATIITPNIPEASFLANMQIDTKNDMVLACNKTAKDYNGYILLKGGHLKDTSDDLLWCGGKSVWFSGDRIDTKNTHGTGCTLSSAIAVNLARNIDIESCVKISKDYVYNAIKHNEDIGHGNGPLNHGYNINSILKTC